MPPVAAANIGERIYTAAAFIYSLASGLLGPYYRDSLARNVEVL
jgi:hypothetical protein